MKASAAYAVGEVAAILAMYRSVQNDSWEKVQALESVDQDGVDGPVLKCG